MADEVGLAAADDDNGGWGMARVGTHMRDECVYVCLACLRGIELVEVDLSSGTGKSYTAVEVADEHHELLVAYDFSSGEHGLECARVSGGIIDRYLTRLSQHGARRWVVGYVKLAIELRKPVVAVEVARPSFVRCHQRIMRTLACEVGSAHVRLAYVRVCGVVEPCCLD